MELFRLALTRDEIQAAFRAAIEYRRYLKFSEIKDSLLVGKEVNAIDAFSEKMSLVFHYPAKEEKEEVKPKDLEGVEQFIDDLEDLHTIESLIDRLTLRREEYEEEMQAIHGFGWWAMQGEGK